MDNFLSTGFVMFIALGIEGANSFTGCQSPQYLQNGTSGTISCSFQDNFLSVYWYDTEKYTENNPVIEYQNSVKRGEGYDSGMFDVHQNGSLIITNVSLEDDHIFIAIETRSIDDYKLHPVRVIVTVKPAVPYPVIESCGQISNLCYVQLTRGTELNCYVENARPAIALNWIARTVNGDRNLSSVFETTNNGFLNTSTSTTHDPLAYTSWLNLLVCKAHNLPGVLTHDESLALVETDITDPTNRDPVSKYVEMKSKIVLPCSQKDKTIFVWKHRQKANNVFSEIAYGVHWYSNNSTFESGGYNLTNNGGLTISELQPKHEGLYACIAGNGATETVSKYEITAYVPPDPPNPLVEGCSRSGYCVLAVSRQGNLTCSVKRIRPKVDLIWKTFDDISSHDILLYDSKLTRSTNEDGTFDVLLMTYYDASRSTVGKITMECKVSEVGMEIFDLSTKLDLSFVEGGVSATDIGAVSNGEKVQYTWLIFIPVVLFVVIIVVVLFTKGKHLKTRLTQCEDEKHDDEQTVPLRPTHKAMKKEFIQQLREKYADLTANVCPVPYMRETMYSVNDVFVDSGYEFLLRPRKWETLESYEQIFSDSRLGSCRRIIEGDPGYGKSILTLQFAYDWCNETKKSPLREIDIFVLLQLRQLGGVKSIFEAIKDCLLPRDTKVSSDDIENILEESKSVLVVLDGYDEYPHKGDKNTSFIEDIMKGDILQCFDFILTTRTACLPKNYSRQTKKIRIHGFDDKAREAYLQKVLVDEDHDPIENIQKKLKENPFLEDLCHIPLFFVLFSHLSSDKEHVLEFNSVTVFFHHIITCLQSHMKNKARNPTEEIELEPYDKDHRKLDKLAFDGLSGKSLVWKKDSVCHIVGEDFYEHYVSMGVLVEEKVQFIKDVPGSYSAEHILYRQEVRFYHKLFCEWYAAHFLADYAANPEVSLDPRHEDENSVSPKHEVDSLHSDPNQEVQKPRLENLDPADVQYVYRFACGLNGSAAEKIYQYLTSTHGGDKFAILCILEQRGKLEEIKPTIEKLCARTVTFRSEHSKLVHRSTIQLLEIAASLEIPIANLWLYNCFKEVCESSKSILLESGLKISRLNTLLALDIWDNDRAITREEALGILDFCIQCRQLKSLKFKNCLMPLIIKTEQTNSSQKKHITVAWDTGFGSCFTLNLGNGSWQHADDSRTLTEDEYEKERRRHENPEK